MTLIEFMRLKPGDVVKVKKDLTPDQEYGSVYYRSYMTDKVVTVKDHCVSTYRCHLRVVESHYVYSPEMLDRKIPSFKFGKQQK